MDDESGESTEEGDATSVVSNRRVRARESGMRLME